MPVDRDPVKRRVAAIDIGTNSVLMLVAEVAGDELRAVVDEATITRLGQGVGATGTLAPEAVERTLGCLSRYAGTLKRLGASDVIAVATSAMRDASNGNAFLDRAEAILGTRPEVIAGEREAELTFRGALSGLRPADRVAVFDVGGGSTEVIVGRADGAIEAAASVDVGAVRLTERHVVADPPGSAALSAIRRDAEAALATAPRIDGLPLVGVAGTVTTLAAMVAGVTPYRGEAVHGARLALTTIEAAAARLGALPLAERRSLPGLDPGRADVIVAGAIIVAAACRAAGAEALVVSDRGVRWGLASELAGRGGQV